MVKLVAIDFFCGIGGLTKGLSNAGIEVICGIDVDPSVEETYTNNNKGTIFIREDIRNISARKLLQKFGMRSRKKVKVIFAACAPCQPFSYQNRKRDSKDHRRTLLLEFARLVNEGKPDYIFVENVPGIVKKKGNSIYRRFIKVLERNGYHYTSKVVEAKYYGVPQRRRRFVLLGSKHGEILFPEETHDGRTIRFATVRDVIFKYPPIAAGERHKTVSNHWAGNLSETNLLRLRYVPKNGGDRRSFPKNLVLRCHKRYRGHTDVYGRMRWDEPAPTLTCKCASISNGRFGHPEQDRGISLREAAALQTFSDDYIFYENPCKLMQHIGNAVPVLFAEICGREFVTHAQSIAKPQ